MIPTFRPWTHTSDDSYMYQLSLVVATATTVSCILPPGYDSSNPVNARWNGGLLVTAVVDKSENTLVYNRCVPK